jgi:SAM-dependent methyltransferase
MQRSAGAPELLDQRAYAHLAELRDNLNDMARYGRRLGAFALARRRLSAACAGRLALGLDLGCGGGEFLADLQSTQIVRRWVGADLLWDVLRIARSKQGACVILVDLSRSRLALAAAWLLTRLTSRNRLTRSDGVLSVRRAYTVAEAAKLAQQAGWECVHAEQHGLFYYSLVWSSSATNRSSA